MGPEDVTLDIEGDVLTICGERREEQRTEGHHEVHDGASSRRVRLPRDVDPDG
ncbi:Hsp20/alpha crystallin family protein [Knoellia aerolata]|uniref:Hsp20/alpha crystallin family protein n=1 Tax=Knoellia aerolata TaxID=442954 RepID=UPI000B327927|nr:Hsp20/alpha crystallin family protein [Knoellia aerolata]